jgi:hypothetical protein
VGGGGGGGKDAAAIIPSRDAGGSGGGGGGRGTFMTQRPFGIQKKSFFDSNEVYPKREVKVAKLATGDDL